MTHGFKESIFSDIKFYWKSVGVRCNFEDFSERFLKRLEN